jgi:hypothetical protein
MIFLILLMIGLTGCQSIVGEDISVTLSTEMTAFATEVSMIQQEAQSEQTLAVETLQASGTSVADASNINAVLASTVQSNVAPTISMREVIVNPDDMGDSLDTEMMDEDMTDIDSDEILVRNLGTAKGVRTSDGCTNGNVTQFTDNDERIYFTAQVFGLQDGTNFSLDWVFEERLVYRSVWVADYSAHSECIWFYMTPDDAPFLSGLYTVTLFMNDIAQPPQQFSINAG